MRLDIEFRAGERNKPAIVFIHGLGMDKTIWTSPCESRIGGGLFSLGLLIRKKPEGIVLYDSVDVEPQTLTTGIQQQWLRTSFHDLEEDGYPVITWSQKRPSGPLSIVVEELDCIIKFASVMTDKGIIIVAHSRGGLIARKYLESRFSNRISGLITISTPHRGSTMAEWVNHLSLIGSILSPFSSYFPEGKISKAIKRISELFKSEAINELLPDSPLIKSLKPLDKRVKHICIAGTGPRLFSIYRWKLYKEEKAFYLNPEELFSFPESIIPFLPARIVPEEWKPGRGDGLVSVESACPEEQCFQLGVNHAAILMDNRARDYIRNLIKGF